MPDAWTDRQLKPGMVEGKDYVALKDNVAIVLIKAYQVTQNPPLARFGITASDEEGAESCYEAYMKRIEFTVVPNDGFMRLKSTMSIHVSRSLTVEKMQKKISRVLNQYHSQVNKERTLLGPTRLWISSCINQYQEEMKKLDYNWRNFEDTTIDAIPVLPLTGDPLSLSTAMQERVEYLKYEDGVDIIVVEC